MSDSLQTQWSYKVLALLPQEQGERIELIEDPDHLLSGDVIRLLGKQGWSIAYISNPLELRLAYEQNVRSLPMDNVKQLYVLTFPINKVPYDILQAGLHVLLKVKNCFPILNEKVLQQLPSSWLPIIDHNLKSQPISRKVMDEQETIAFILDACLGITLPLAPSRASALNLLADLVLRDLELPPVFVRHIVERVSAVWSGDFKALVSTPTTARNYLQQVWRVYLNRFTDTVPALAEGGLDSLAISTDILANDRGLQSQISALLAENMILPPTIQLSHPVPEWIHPGVHFHVDYHSYLAKRLEQIGVQIPGEGATSDHWCEFAWQWAEWRQSFVQNVGGKSGLYSQMVEIQVNIETIFLEWLKNCYSDLIAHPYLPAPKMVHHVLHYISARLRPCEENPVTIIVIDGMSIEDWNVIRNHLLADNPNWQIRERSLFALVPSLTPVSRKALLSGQLPQNFVGDWLSTNTEEAAWRLFWESRGFHPGIITYQRGLGVSSGKEVSLDDATESILNQPHKAVTALIVNALDDLMHNDILGIEAFLQQVAIWAKKGYLRQLIGRLLEQHETVIITADHGHIEGRGIGDIALKDAAVERSLRARIFSDQAYEMTERDPETVLQWSNTGLPDNTRVYIPSNMGLFAKPGVTAISHGGAALEEIIIPFITISRTPS